jgi:drug/metabolite transporter (DMT)-like permease
VPPSSATPRPSAKLTDNAAVLLTACCFFWAINWIISRAMRHDMGPLTMALGRWLIALAVLLPLCGRELWEKRREIAAHWPVLAALSLTGTGAYNALSIMGLRTTTAINGALLNAIIPVVIALLAWATARKRLGARQGAWMAVSFAGALWIATNGSWQQLLALKLNPGDLWIAVAMVSWSVYTVLFNHRKDSLGLLSLIALLSLMSLVLLVPLAVWEMMAFQAPAFNARSMSGWLFQGLAPAIFCYYAWNRGVQLAGPARAGLYLYLIPLFSAALSSMFLGEYLQGFHVVGAALIVIGVVMANRAAAAAGHTGIRENPLKP